MPAAKGSWQFTTAAAAATHALRFPLDLSAAPVRWHGGFFTGFYKPSFCTSASNRIPAYELMDGVQRTAAATVSQGDRPKTTPDPVPPSKAWSLQRDFWMTGMEHQPGFISGGLPNVVWERETRRITVIENRDDGVLLRVEDFFRLAQYGIASAAAGDERVQSRGARRRRFARDRDRRGQRR